jgi:hypothetical protein
MSRQKDERERKILEGRIEAEFMRRYHEIEKAEKYAPGKILCSAPDYREGARLNILLCIDIVHRIFNHEPIERIEMVEPPTPMPEWFP